jgi:type I restriction enzyme S subunit
MKWQKYKEYKDTEAKWLPPIPSHWQIVSLGRLGYFRNGINKGRESFGSGCKFVTVNNLYGEGFIDISDLGRVEISDDELRIYSLKEGDILFARSSVKREGVGNPGLVGKLEEPIVFAGFVIRFRISFSDIDYFYLYWLLKSKGIREIIVASSNTVAQTNLSQPHLKEINICLPPKAEQNIISNFINKKTDDIDRLIEKKVRQIELLQEKRAALIGQAVTRGLDPTVKTKDPHIPWLGPIPSHWEVTKFKYQIFFQEGPGIMAEDFQDSGIPLLRINNLTPGYINLEGCNYLDPDKVLKKWNQFKLKKDDLLISASATTGIVSKVDERSVGSIPYTGLICLRPMGDSIITDYIKYLAISDIFITQIDLMKTGSTIQHYGPTHLRQMFIVLPPTAEQKKITTFLDRETGRIDQLIGGVRESVERLREYRGALISAAVTGKIDVRE